MSNLSLRWKIALVTVVVGIVSIPASLAIFKPSLPGGASLPVGAIPFLLGMKVFEGLALGAGISFLIFGYSLLARASQSRTLTLLAYFSIGWYLSNWWLHDNLHAVNGDNLWGLLAIEYAFHFTLIAAAGVLAVFFYRAVRRAAGPA